ncbi:MAG: pyridoxamine 5'-phosphate oxidase family protein [Bacteroidaceae bacterium]|nr:pyridoxamine 5'-phosphate oxidase family protein [Bacteroidaceae bacterium]MBQ9176232.1 pyridoxamine 5'-phosphate oxidase family protein [Bacteroidaceae bacterium]
MIFREMRRKRQQLSDAECEEIFSRCTSGTLALLGDGGYPYALPISYVYANRQIYFHSAVEGHKIDAIKACNKASFCVIAQDDVKPQKFTTYFRSVIAFGHIGIVADATEKLEAAKLLARRYAPGDEAGMLAELDKGLHRMVIIRLDIEHLSGKQAIELQKERMRMNMGG